jgi:hypothetical protein
MKRKKLLLLLLITGTCFFAGCKKESSCEQCAAINKSPVADAGADVTLSLPTDSTLLDGSNSRGTDRPITEWVWTKIAGPASFTITNAATSRTTVNSLTGGIYLFELKVTDARGLFDRDTMQVTVIDPRSNQPPVANAGTDISITLPVTTVALDGRNSSDPDNNITSYYWIKISGPTSYSLPSPSAPWTTLNSLTEGIYQFELKVTDAEGLFDRDTVSVTVMPYPPPVNCQPNRPQIPVQPVELNNMPGHIRWPRMFNTTDNRLVIVAAGDYYYPSERTINVYNKTTMQWTTSAISESMIRYGWNIITAGTKVFFTGGMSYNPNQTINTFSRVDVYDIATNTWSVANLSEARAFVSSIVVGNKIFFAGGMKADRTFSSRVDVFDMNTNSWSTSQLAGTPRAIIGSAVVNNKIFFCGGYTEFMDYTGYGEVLGLPVPAVDVYDLATGQWSLDAMTQTKDGFATISKNGTLYLAGGYDYSANSVTAVVEEINTLTNQRSFSCLSGPNTFGSNVTSFNNWLIFYGDNAFTGTIPDRLELYDTQTGSWTIGNLPAGMFREGYWTSIIADGNKVYMAANDKLYQLNF